jgi:hypothetical protein
MSHGRELKNELAGSAAHARALGRGFLADGPSKDTVQLLDVIKRSFGGHPEQVCGHLYRSCAFVFRWLHHMECCSGGLQGDPVLEVRLKETVKPRDHQQWAAYVKSRRLAPDWELQLDQHVSNYVTDVFVQQVLACLHASIYGCHTLTMCVFVQQLVPTDEEVAAVTAAVTACVPRAWPRAVIDDVSLDDLCHVWLAFVCACTCV